LLDAAFRRGDAGLLAKLLQLRQYHVDLAAAQQ
jgi:hypothetical protein